MVLNPQPHTWTDVHACAHTHHKGKLRQLLGKQYKQPHQTCRQTDDYLHDKDLKYSHQNVFPWSASTAFHVYLQAKWSGFDIKTIFQRPERRWLWQHICQDWAPSFFSFEGEEQRGHIAVFQVENHLMRSRNIHLLFLTVHTCALCVYAQQQKCSVHLFNSQICQYGQNKTLKKVWTFPGINQMLKHTRLSCTHPWELQLA